MRRRTIYEYRESGDYRCHDDPCDAKFKRLTPALFVVQLTVTDRPDRCNYARNSCQYEQQRRTPVPIRRSAPCRAAFVLHFTSIKLCVYWYCSFNFSCCIYVTLRAYIYTLHTVYDVRKLQIYDHMWCRYVSRDLVLRPRWAVYVKGQHLKVTAVQNLIFSSFSRITSLCLVTTSSVFKFKFYRVPQKLFTRATLC